MRCSKNQPDLLLTLVTGVMVYHADNSHIQKHSVKKGKEFAEEYQNTENVSGLQNATRR